MIGKDVGYEIGKKIVQEVSAYLGNIDNLKVEIIDQRTYKGELFSTLFTVERTEDSTQSVTFEIRVSEDGNLSFAQRGEKYQEIERVKPIFDKIDDVLESGKLGSIKSIDLDNGKDQKIEFLV